MDHNIDVVIRSRPLIKREIGSDSLWTTNKNSICSKDKTFNFDRVFGQETVNLDIYNEIGKSLVKNVMQGINGTLFAYGQTASGKTHTIIGEQNELGIVPLAIKDIFAHINESPTREFLLRASYMEIYNEEIKDLLDSSGSETALRIRNNIDNEIVIDNLSEHTITSYENVMGLIESGIRNRKTGTTNLNERSSRSHCIFQLVIESRAITGDDANHSESIDDGAVIVSQLNLVDLAGSERASQTGAIGIRFKESNFINTSLMTLGLVIRKLSENEKNAHIPYRDSKLTRILQHSLGGNAKTAIIATVSPVVYDETVQTLMFAERAKNVKNKPIVNEVVDGDTMLRRQRREISELKKKISELESGASFVQHHDMTKQKNRVAALLKQIICAGPRKKEPSIALQKKMNRRQTCCPGELKMRVNDSMVMDEDVFDDTTLNFERLEFKFLKEEMEMESTAPSTVGNKVEGKLEELKSVISEKDDEIGGLLKIIKDLQTQVADIPTLKDAIESLGAENQMLQSSYEKSTAKYMALSKQTDSVNEELTQLRGEQQSEQLSTMDTDTRKERLMAQITTLQEEIGEGEMSGVLLEMMKAAGKAEEFVTKKRYMQLEGDIATLKDALESLGEESTMLQNMVDKKNEDIKVLKEKEESFVYQLTLYQKERDQLKQESGEEKENMLAKLTEVTCEKETLHEELEQLKAEAKEVSESGSEVSLTSLKEENQTLINTIDKQGSEITLLMRKEKHLTDQMTSVMNERDSKSNQVDQLLHESSEFLVDKENILGELTGTINERNSLKDQVHMNQVELEEGRARIEDCNISIAQLQELLKAKEDTLVEKVQYISNLLAKDGQQDAKLHEKDEQIENLKKWKEEMESVSAGSKVDADTGTTLNEAIQSLTDENKILQEAMAQKMEENTTLQNHSTSLETKIEQLLAKQEGLLTEVSQLVMVKEQLLDELSENKRNFENHMAELNSVQMNQDDVSNISESYITDMKKQIVHQETVLNENERRLTENERRITEMVDEINAKESVIVELKEQMAHQENVLSEKNVCIQNLQDVVNSNEHVIVEMKKQIVHVESGMNEKEVNVRGLKEELDAKNSELSQTQLELVLLKDGVEEQRKSGDAEIESLQQQLASVNTQIDELNALVEQKTSEYTTLSEQHEIMNSEMQNINSEKDELIEHLGSLQEKVSTLDDEMLVLLKQLESTKDTNVLLKNQVVEKGEECELLRKQEEENSAELDRLETEIDDLTVNINDLEKTNTQISLEKENILKELNDALTNCSQLQNDVNMLKSENEELVEKKDETDRELRSAQAEITKKKEELKKSETEVEELKLLLNEKTVLLKEKDVITVKLNEELDELRTEVSDKKAEISVLKSSINSKEEDIKMYLDRIRAQEHTMEKMEEKQVLYQEKISKLTSDLQELNKPCGNTDIKEWNKKVVNLESDLFELKQRYKKRQNDLKEAQERKYELSVCKERLENSNETLMCEIDQLKKSLETQKTSSKESLEELKVTLKTQHENAMMDQQRNHERIGEGLETAYKKYKQYKELFLDAEAECEKYRKMLEEVSIVAQQTKLKSKRATPSKVETKPAAAAASPLSVNLQKGNVDTTEREGAKRKLEDTESNVETCKKAFVEPAGNKSTIVTATSGAKLPSDKDDGCQQQ